MQTEYHQLVLARNVMCHTHLDCRVVLATASEYFRRRLDGWDNDPWTTSGADGKLLLVVSVEERLIPAAQAVIRLMYEEVVPASTGPLRLAEVRGSC
jgi:hypothetical protein